MYDEILNSFKSPAAALLCLATVTSAQNACPPAEILAPCTCIGLTIECSKISGRFNIKQIFDNVSPLINETVAFYKLIISETSLVELPSKAIEHLKFWIIEITDNSNLEYIYKDSFAASLNTTTILLLDRNHLTNFGAEERDIYEFASQFVNLETLSFRSNALTSFPPNALDPLVNLKELWFLEYDIDSIPSGALNLPNLISLRMEMCYLKEIPDYGFGILPSLYELEMHYCTLRYVGKEAFASSPNLTRTRLGRGFLGANSFHPDAFKGLTQGMRIDLSFNPMSYLTEEVFKPLLDSAEIVYVGGTSGFNTVYFECDERMDWICGNATYYRTILNGVRCRGIDDFIWKYCESLVE